MHPSRPVRALLVGVCAAFALGATPAVAAPADAPHRPGAASPQPPTAGVRDQPPLADLADLAARRLLTADLVAAAKWGTDSPIDDPAREREVLDAVAREAAAVGGDPQVTRAVFRDQIEANKLVQRTLHRRWRAAPWLAPADRPDLTEVRAEINRVNSGLVRAVADAEPLRNTALCPVTLLAAARAHHTHDLDGLHAVALVRGLRSVCAPVAAPGR
ncbi:gamma subclass chorismate mutase AroQ [Streptomyces sp. HSW2009]|uniref:gamma subclass chorismate mutase AroQ n=1 Tax=Streptomyces sp. HSW2009 TaxID=3142890 RepID=UPI0032EC48BB